MLAFVHIEKAAGTTLNHILRSNFLFRHVDIRPFSPGSDRIFQIEDLRKTLKINPYVESISGHSILPVIDLRKIVPDIKYITILRDPVDRYLSQYQYWKEELKYDKGFNYFLTREHSFNLQTRKIAGIDDVDKAKQMLGADFFLVGIVEEFDEFLSLLQKMMLPERFRISYRKQNINNKSISLRTERIELHNQYRGQILQRNFKDIELYQFVKDVLLPKQKLLCGTQSGAREQKDLFYWEIKRFLDFFYRKCYLGPIIGLVRKNNGLPYRGSY